MVAKSSWKDNQISQNMVRKIVRNWLQVIHLLKIAPVAHSKGRIMLIHSFEHVQQRTTLGVKKGISSRSSPREVLNPVFGEINKMK